MFRCKDKIDFKKFFLKKLIKNRLEKNPMQIRYSSLNYGKYINIFEFYIKNISYNTNKY